jgi:hypothetical protein
MHEIATSGEAEKSSILSPSQRSNGLFALRACSCTCCSLRPAPIPKRSRSQMDGSDRGTTRKVRREAREGKKLHAP